MKKAFIIVAMVLVVAMAFAGCGSSEGPISGEYKLTSAIVAGQEMSVDDLKSFMGDSADALDMTFNFSGNKVKVTANGQTEEVKYQLNGEDFSITEGFTTLSGKFQDGKISIEAGGATLVFTK